MARTAPLLLVPIVGLALLASACGDGGETTGSEPTGTADPAPDDRNGPDDGGNGTGDADPPVEPPTGDAAGEPASLAVRDAAERAGVAEDEVDVVRNEAVTWPDGALGCPEEGQFYTQALVEGYRIVVEAGGQTLHYHGRTGGPPAYCADPEEPVNGGTTGTVDR